MLGLGALVLATGAGVAPVAPPESQGIRLQYVRGVGAESCPAERELRAAVVGRLGYDPFEIGARASVLARIASAQSGLVGNI